MQKNRRPIILCSKLSLTHTIDAPYKYFEYALIVSFYFDFLRFGFAVCTAKFGKSDNWKVTLLICKKIADLSFYAQSYRLYILLMLRTSILSMLWLFHFISTFWGLVLPLAWGEVIVVEKTQSETGPAKFGKSDN